MLPIFLSVFNVGKEALKDDSFLSRLRRLGLGDSRATEDNRAEDRSMKRGKGNYRRGRVRGSWGVREDLVKI